MCQTTQAGVTTERSPDDITRPRREPPSWLPGLRRALEVLNTAGFVLLHEPPRAKRR
jgi:hypothetical protein